MRMTLAVGVAVVVAAVSATAQAPARNSDTYQKAAAGWLYVVTSNYTGESGRVLAVDPVSGQATTVRATGYEPDIALSPDGSRMYLSYILPRAGRSVLEVVDTATGQVLQAFQDPDPWPSNGGPYFPRLALSRDGRWLFSYKARGGADVREYYVATLDTATNTPLPDVALVSGCGLGMLMPSAQREKLYVVCKESEDVRVVTLNKKGGVKAEKTSRVRVPGGDQFTRKMVSGFLGRHDDTLTLLKGDGSFVRMNARSGRVVRSGAVDATDRRVSTAGREGWVARARQRSAKPNPHDWLVGRQIWSQAPLLSPDGERLYVLTAAGKDSRAVADQIVVLDASTLKREQVIELSKPASSLTLSADGQRLYAVAAEGQALLVIDTDAGQELRSLDKLGSQLIYAVEVP